MKKLLLLAAILKKEKPDPNNAKKCYKSFLKNKNKNLVEQSTINYSTCKNYRKSKHYLDKVQAKKISQIGSAGKYSASHLYSAKTKAKFFLNEVKTIKNAKIRKISHAY